MPRYAYTTRDTAGIAQSGVLTASAPSDAARNLRRDGRIVVSLTPVADAKDSCGLSIAKIRNQDVIYFATQLSVMIDAGVTLIEALDSIAQDCDDQAFGRIVADLSDQVQSGTEFSVALEKYPRLFDRLFVSLVQASEISGTTGQTLHRISEYLKQDQDTRRRIKGALTYPACMLAFCIMVVLGMLIFVLPRFETIYASKAEVLPLPTRLLLGLSRGMMENWALVTAVIIMTAITGWSYVRSESGRRLLDRMRINMPILGRMYRKAYLARSLRSLATMVSSGLSMSEGLAITARVSGNMLYADVWNSLAEEVKKGSALAEHLSASPLVPRTIIQMIRAGEKTGQLPGVLDRCAGFCQDELKASIKTVTGMIEPLMIVVMGLVIGSIAIALLLPVFGISKVVAY